MKNDRLLIAETFYSIQGEGKSAGIPAVFLRLGGCNLNCSGFTYQDPITQEHLGCDSKAVWRVAKKYSFPSIIDGWEANGWTTHLEHGAHLIITGGEPLLQQRALCTFLKYCDERFSEKIFVEMETNATIAITPWLLQRLDLIHASPKLSHSGEPFEKVYTLEVLREFASQPKTIFKFVLSRPEDIQEIRQYYVEPLGLPQQRVYLMAEGGTRQALDEKESFIVEICKTHGFCFSPRLQIRIWGEVTGV